MTHMTEKDVCQLLMRSQQWVRKQINLHTLPVVWFKRGRIEVPLTTFLHLRILSRLAPRTGFSSHPGKFGTRVFQKY